MNLTKHFFLLVLISISIVQFCRGQITFQKTFTRVTTMDCNGNSVQQTSDGGYIISGGSLFNTIGIKSDIILIKTDQYGDTLWTRTYGVLGTAEIGYNVKETTDGGFIVVGTEVVSSQIYVLKTDGSGNLQWAKSIYRYDRMDSRVVLQATNGNYMIAAFTLNSFTNIGGLCLINFDGSGNLSWTKTFTSSPGFNIYSMIETFDNGFLATGSYSNGTNSSDVMAIRMDSLGNVLWSKEYSMSGFDEGKSIISTGNGTYMICGRCSNVNSDLYLISINDTGNLLWSKNYSNPNFEESYSIIQCPDSGLVIVGTTYHNDTIGSYSNAILIKTDMLGNLTWSKSLGDSLSYFIAGSMTLSQDSGFAIVGQNRLAYPGDLYFVKTDSEGNSNCGEFTFPLIEANTSAVENTFLTSIDTIQPYISTFSPVVGGDFAVNIVCTTGFDEINVVNYSLFPNPTTGNFTISFPSTINKGTITVTNTMGAKLYSQNIINTNTANINLKNFAKGIYFVQMNDSEKQFCKKIVIE